MLYLVLQVEDFNQLASLLTHLLICDLAVSMLAIKAIFVGKLVNITPL